MLYLRHVKANPQKDEHVPAPVKKEWVVKIFSTFSFQEDKIESLPYCFWFV